MNILLVSHESPLFLFEEKSETNIFNRFIANKIYYFEKSITIPTIAALVPEKHSVEISEAGRYNIDFKKDYDLVGITSLTSDVLNAYELADEFRRRGTAVVLGGWHPSALPEEAKQHADSVVIGEAEETWPQLLKDFEKGQMKPYYIPTRPVDPELIPHPKTDLYPKGTNFMIQATRGCPYGCDFCSITHTKFRNKFRMRPIDKVIEEIKLLPSKAFSFSDNSLTINPSYTKRLFTELKSIDKIFGTQANVNLLADDKEFLKLASEAGCISLFIGFESVNQESLDAVGKPNNVEKYLSAVKNIHDHGMIAIGSFILGFDQDTPDIFEKTNEFVRKAEIDVPYFQVLTPYPGTPLFDRLDKEGRILTKNWNKYNFEHIIYQPKNISREELLSKTMQLRKKWYTIPRLVKKTLRSIGLGYYPFIYTAMRNAFLKLSRYDSCTHNIIKEK